MLFYYLDKNYQGMPSSKQMKLAEEMESAPLNSARQEINRTGDWWNLDFNELELAEVVGEGSYGVVYKASYHDQLVAFKTMKDLNEQQMEEFKREAALMV